MAQATADEPILASWKVGQVLKRYPALLDVLVQQSPKFGHLRNPIVRRVQAPLVTLAQAAQVAGLEPASLVRILNQAAGLSTPEAATESEMPAQTAKAAYDLALVAVDLDVRDYQARGEEPFSAIMAAVAQVPLGKALRLRNTFEPFPLYDVLAKRGFVHAAHQLGPDDWEILFVRTPGGDPASTTPADAPAQAPSATAEDEPFPAEWGDPARVVTVDVSDLVPPEPMVRILEAMASLPAGQTLLVNHARRPVYLYPRLEELGYQHRTRELGPSSVEILIHKPA